jgi:hypothetical protein
VRNCPPGGCCRIASSLSLKKEFWFSECRIGRIVRPSSLAWSGAYRGRPNVRRDAVDAKALADEQRERGRRSRVDLASSGFSEYFQSQIFAEVCRAGLGLSSAAFNDCCRGRSLIACLDRPAPP